MIDFASLPKTELHLHLDCSLSYDVVQQLDPSVTRAEFDQDFIAPAKCTNLADFLSRTPKGIALMQDERGLQMVVDDMFRQLQADNVIYAEIRFAPLLHLDKGLTSAQVVELVEQATRQAIENTGIEARLILCTLRHYTSDQSLETVRLVEQFQGTTVAAFDLAGDEAGYPITEHQAAFNYAIDNHLPRTSHAGEAAGAASVWETLEHFKPSRIGHGVRSIEDPALMEHLRDHNICLEVCPSCNIQIDVFDVYENHPVDQLYEANIPLSISSDNRTITPITLTQEYEKLADTFGWQTDHFFRTNQNAINAGFIPDDVKQRLLAQLAAGYGQ